MFYLSATQIADNNYSMQGGEAFLSIISKLSENINPSEEVHETEADTSTTFNINTDNQQGNNAEYNETDLQFNSSDQTVVSDAVGMALFLVKRKFNIVPPFTAAQISSGNISSILSFLSLLHNVALVNQVCIHHCQRYQQYFKCSHTYRPRQK